MRLRVYWKHKNKTGFYDYDWPYDFEGGEFYLAEGNLGCDCNLCHYTGIEPDPVIEWPCGNTIKVIKVEEIKS